MKNKIKEDSASEGNVYPAILILEERRHFSNMLGKKLKATEVHCFELGQDFSIQHSMSLILYALKTNC